MYSQILRESGNYGCVLLFMEKKFGRKFKIFYNFYINFYFLFLSLYINLIRKVKVNPFLYFVFFNVRSSTLKNKYRCSKENMIAFEKICATAPRKGSIWDYKTKVKFMSWSKVLP